MTAMTITDSAGFAMPELAANVSVPISLIDTSKTNPRTHFDATKLGELAASIAKHGVLQPILIRPIGDRFELVAGERRFRACKLAGLEMIPAVVKSLDDKAALEVQVVENLQRADLSPLEEAEGYARLIRSHGYDAEALAVKIGKSKSYVYSRMKLAELCEPAKDALASGRLPQAHALLLARIPDSALQEKALDRILPAFGDAIPYSRARTVVTSDFALRLDGASFDTTDAELVPQAGACTTCPFRSSNQAGLFEDEDDVDRCTLPICFDRKAEADWQKAAASYRSRGLNVLTLEQGKKIAPWGHVQSGTHVDITAICYSDAEHRTYKKLLPKETTLSVLRTDDGRIIKVAAKKDVDKVLEVEAPKRNLQRPGDGLSYEERQAVEEATSRAIVEGFLAIAAEGDVDDATEDMVLRGLLIDIDVAPSEIDNQPDPDAWAAKLTRTEVLAHLAEMLYARDPFRGDGVERRAAFLGRIGVDPEAIAREVVAGRRAAEKAEAAAAAPAKAKRTKGGAK